MADAPWRCSQCGTINEPAANSCRTCGRWPSLFDLEEGTVDAEAESPEPYVDEPYVEEPPQAEHSPDEPRWAEEPEPAAAKAEEGAPSPPVPEARWPGPEPAIPQRQGAWVRRLSRFAIPLIVLAYVLITALRH